MEVVGVAVAEYDATFVSLIHWTVGQLDLEGRKVSNSIPVVFRCFLRMKRFVNQSASLVPTSLFRPFILREIESEI